MRTILSILVFALCIGRVAADESAKASTGIPPIIKFEIKVYETVGTGNQSVGFDWYTSNALHEGGNVDPNPSRRMTPGSPATLTGILNDAQFRTVVRALEASQNSRAIASSDLSTSNGKLLELRRADGWTFQLQPTFEGGRIKSPLRIEQTKGDYAGFELKTDLFLRNGEAAIFSDVVYVPNKKKETTLKRLLITIVPTFINGESAKE